MPKTTLNKPVLFSMYGYPGAGKTYLARNLEHDLFVARISADHIRHELFSKPRYDAQENNVVTHLMNYITGEFLNTGVSVIYDINAMRPGQRRQLRELARSHKAEYMFIWLQIDPENAFLRTQRRDRRTLDDKYSEDQSKNSFERQMALMQNPENEDYVVISGKHTYSSQKNAILNKLFQSGLVSAGTVQGHVAKPGLVNLVPNLHAGRVDMNRRNISID